MSNRSVKIFSDKNKQSVFYLSFFIFKLLQCVWNRMYVKLGIFSTDSYSEYVKIPPILDSLLFVSTGKHAQGPKK